MVKKIIGSELVTVRKNPNSKGERKFITILGWGDEIDLISTVGNFHEIKFDYFKDKPDGSFDKIKRTGTIKKSTKLYEPQENPVLKMAFVDVQQGDGIFIETPSGKKIIVDGGQKTFFARYIASKFIGTSHTNPLDIDALVVTHGDADHFEGLTNIWKSENHKTHRKRLFLYPKRIFHNGMIKGKSTKPVETIFGKTIIHKKKKFLTDLFDEISKVSKTKLNSPYKNWVDAIKSWQERGEILQKRLEFGDDDQFSFLSDEGIDVKVLGPFTETINGKTSLPLLKDHKNQLPSVDVLKEDDSPKNKIPAYSASHTINGHSIILKLEYNKIRFLLTGDLNTEAEQRLRKLASKRNVSLRSEIFKVPHHGSHEFSNKFLKSVSPVVSVVSSGDEAEKEYIHPRAPLVGSLGKNSRIKDPLIFITELAAFFQSIGLIFPEKHKTKRDGEIVEIPKSNQKYPFWGFERRAYGIVHVRTDGEKVLVFTHSGSQKKKEAYSFVVGSKRKISFQKVKKIT